MYQCLCGLVYEHQSQVRSCTNAGHYQQSNNNNNPVVPSQGRQATGRTASNSSSSVLVKVMEHQQFFTNITKELILGSKTQAQWAEKIQEQTTILINEVQQINI